MVRLLFICDTNTSLSPLLEAIFLRDLRQRARTKESPATSPEDKLSLCDAISVDTAGCFAGSTPRPLERRCRLAAEKHGLNVNAEHRSRTIVADELPTYDMFIVMNEANFWHLKRLDETLDGTKVRLLMEFTEQLGLREMPDPVQGQIEFDEALALLEKASPFLLDHVISFFKLS